MSDTEMPIRENDECGSVKKNNSGCRGCLIALLFALLLLVLTSYVLWKWEVYRGYVVSPCGKYRVDYYYYFRESLMPMMPGSSSDKSGCLYIYRQSDNKMLFREELPMIQDVGDIRFEQDESGNTTDIHAPAWLWFDVVEK